MGNDIRNINSIESMLDDLFERVKASEEKITCCKYIVDSREYIAAMDIVDASYIVIFFYNTLNDNHLIVNIEKSEDWEEANRKLFDFLGCSYQSELTVASYASYWYSRLEPNSDIVTEAIEQNRKFFICCYPETFDNHYDPCDETGRRVLLITEFSDDFEQVHFYIHFEYTNEAFHLSGSTDSTDLLWNLYCEFEDYEEELQVKEKEILNKFYPHNKYAASDFLQIKALFLKAINDAFKSDIGINSIRFRTDAGQFAAQIIVVSSELYEVRVIIHNIDYNQYFSRRVPGRDYFEEIFAVDLFKELFPEEAKEIYNKECFDDLFEKIRPKIKEILVTAAKIGYSSCSFQAVDKEIPELGATYSAEAVLEKGGNLVSLTVKCPSKKTVPFERTVEVGQVYDNLFGELYQFLYPNRIVLLIDDIRNNYEL